MAQKYRKYVRGTSTGFLKILLILLLLLFYFNVILAWTLLNFFVCLMKMVKLNLTPLPVKLLLQQWNRSFCHSKTTAILNLWRETNGCWQQIQAKVSIHTFLYPHYSKCTVQHRLFSSQQDRHRLLLHSERDRYTLWGIYVGETNHCCVKLDAFTLNIYIVWS